MPKSAINYADFSGIRYKLPGGLVRRYIYDPAQNIEKLRHYLIGGVLPM